MLPWIWNLWCTRMWDSLMPVRSGQRRAGETLSSKRWIRLCQQQHLMDSVLVLALTRLFMCSCISLSQKAKVLSFNIFSIVFIFLLQDENQSCRRGGNTSTWDSGIGGLSSISNMASQFEGELAAWDCFILNSETFGSTPGEKRVWVYVDISYIFVSYHTRSEFQYDCKLMFLSICRSWQCLPGTRQSFSQWGRFRGGGAVFCLGVLLRDLQWVFVWPFGHFTITAAQKKGHTEAERWQAGQPLRERWKMKEIDSFIQKKLFLTLYITCTCFHVYYMDFSWHGLFITWTFQMLYCCLSEPIIFFFVLPDLTWIQVRSAEEAWRILRAGRRNQSFASTHLNQNSSRR